MRVPGHARWVLVLGLIVVVVLIPLSLQRSLAYNNFDNPPCFWPYTPGVKKVLYWKYQGYVYERWARAYSASVGDWNSATNRVGYAYSTSATNRLGMYVAADNRSGYTVWYCSGTTMLRFDAYVNDYYTGTDNWRRSVTGHELGHGISLGHSTVSPSLMGPNPDPQVYYKPQPDDIDGVNDRFRW